MARKALMGNKLRRLRQERGLTQAEMALRLAISASYLNLIEHNQRPVTVALLLKLGRVFDVDLQELAGDDERKLVLALREVFADSGLRRHAVGADDLASLVEAAPAAAKAVIELYRAYRGAREDASAMVLGLAGGAGETHAEGVGPARAPIRRLLMPTEEARDFFHDRTNHFPTLESAAERMARACALDPAEPYRTLVDHLRTRHAIRVELAPLESMPGTLRRFDPETRHLVLSQVLPRASRHFQLACQLGLIEARAEIDAILAESALGSEEARTLVRVGLANYFAGALLMPYAPFLAGARDRRYDVEALCHRFGVSFEQVCHRLSTLQRPGESGIPFFLVRVDIAGNISKRFSAAGFHFSRFGGSCPRWVVHEAFMTPGLIRTQLARLPDGATFFCVARTVSKESGGFHEPRAELAIAIGCDIAHARELVYADGWDLARADAASEIGVGCRLCERPNCRSRAFPPLRHRLMLDEQVRAVAPYPFSAGV